MANKKLIQLLMMKSSGKMILKILKVKFFIRTVNVTHTVFWLVL